MELAEQLRILQAAKGEPALLALATVDLAHPRLAAAERLRIKDALLAAAVPHWCDRDVLAALLQATPEEADRLLGELSTLTVIEPFPARGKHAINVHENTRLALREHLRTANAPLWQALSARARAHIAQSREPHARIEALYHLFATDQPAAAKECEALDQEFTAGGRPEVWHALALALRELTAAGWLTGAAEVEALLSPLEVRNARGEAGAQLETEARQLVQIARSASVPSGIARAQSLLGDVLQTKGRLDDARDAFREFLAIFQRLTAADPTNARLQRELAVAHSKVGGIHQEQGRLDDALAAFREDLAIFQHLTATAPANAGWQRELSIAHARVGDIYQEQGRLDDALAAFRENLAILQRLAATDPSNANWQRDLSIAHSRVGDIYREQGRLDDALAAFRELLAILQRITVTDPSNANWQRDLTVAHARVGDIDQEQGRLDDALAAFREKLAISQRLAATDPSNAGWQRDLAIAHARVGGIHRAQGRLDDALAAFREDLAISQQPRASLGGIGVSKGTLLFKGRKIGNTYAGKAFIYSKCGAKVYDVTGPISDDQRQVTLYGRAPITDQRCNVRTYREDTLIFTFNGN
jgi:tetratricopeptide (TPR) repeat protein